MLSLTDIESQVRFFAGNDDIILTSGVGKIIFNSIYAKVALVASPESRNVINIGVTTSGQGSYGWGTYLKIY